MPRAWVWAGLFGLLLAALLLGVAVGSVPLPWPAVVGGLLHPGQDPIVFDLRLPRVLGAMLVGAALGVSGAAYQGLFKNPLADPYLMGTAAGAAFGAAVGLVLEGRLSPAYAEWIRVGSGLTVPFFAFLGALFAVFLAVVLAGGVGRTRELILSGVVVGSVLTGLTTYLMLAGADRVRAVFAYTLGNLAFLGWPEVGRLALYLAVALPVLVGLARVLNAMQLGETVARTMGLPLEALKLVLVVAATLVTAGAVAEAGIIGFVGLVVPHALRRLGGGDYRFLIPASALGGAGLLVFADLVARVLVRPAELPVGVVTTLLGGPFFLYLLWRMRARG